MDAFIVNESTHVHPVHRTQPCCGCFCVLFTISSSETQKNKPQTDWPHFPASEQKKMSFCLSKWWKLSCIYKIIRLNKFLMGKMTHGAVMHVMLSFCTKVSVASHRQTSLLFARESVHYDLAMRLWIKAKNWKYEYSQWELLNVFLSPMLLL